MSQQEHNERKCNMPFIEMGKEFANAKEPEVAANGEYDLTCKDVEHMTDGGKNSLRVQVKIDGKNDYAPIFHYIGLPHPDDAKKDEEKGHDKGTTRSTKALMARRFCHAFNIPITPEGFDTNDIKGATARLPLTQDTYLGRRKNVITLPYLPADA